MVRKRNKRLLRCKSGLQWGPSAADSNSKPGNSSPHLEQTSSPDESCEISRATAVFRKTPISLRRREEREDSGFLCVPPVFVVKLNGQTGCRAPKNWKTVFFRRQLFTSRSYYIQGVAGRSCSACREAA